jgi:hypothetical protein
MATKGDLKIPTGLLDQKLPRWGPPKTAAPHPNPKFRRTTVGEEYGTIDKRGEYHGPTTGMLPERVVKWDPWPQQQARKAEAEARRLKKLQL